MGPTVERIGEIDCTIVGEGPYWDTDSQSLFFVDVFKKEIHKYVPATRKHTKATVKIDKPGFITVCIPVKDQKNKFVLSFGRELYTIDWDGEKDDVVCGEKLCEVDSDPEISDNNFCDGKCDPSGRLWIGTMGARVGNDFKKSKGSLYCYADKQVNKHLSDITISNGMAWDLTHKKYYHIDSLKYSIDAFDYDSDTNTISNKTSIFTLEGFKDIKGFFDGMTIDTEGNLWVAVFGSYKILKIDPRKHNTLLTSIELPAKQPTSVVFGGRNLDELYVTTASNTWDEELSPPWHGATYRITNVGATGFPSIPVSY